MGGSRLWGVFAAFLGSALIAVIFLFFGGFPDGVFFFVFGSLSGFLGCCVDSIIGAALEGRSRFFDNHMTNFLGTLAGGVFGIVFYLIVDVI